MRLDPDTRLARTKNHRIRRDDTKRLSLLEIIGILAQIFLAGVAIFGYFYTVRPIYQKEQLAEQVAEYDSIIKKQGPKIKEIEAQLQSLERERTALSGQLLRERSQLAAELQRERVRMAAELKGIEQQLSQARSEKQQLESQQEFMTFRYRTADGAPARTREQVRIAQRSEVRDSTLRSISLSCSFHSGPFSKYGGPWADKKNAAWPFTPDELAVWKEQGIRIPQKRITDCVVEGANRTRARDAAGLYADDIEAVKVEILQFTERAASSKSWIPPYKPEDIIQDLQKRTHLIAGEQSDENRAVDEKYKERDSAWGDRKTLLQNYHEIERRNARINALNKTYEAENEARKKSEEFRKSFEVELDRLLPKEVRR
jgi:hypothetical protein